MTAINIWNILIVDDDNEICLQVQKYLENQKGEQKYKVSICNDFESTLSELVKQVFDILILDVRHGLKDDKAPLEEAGMQSLSAIKEKRFIPVIFYTALPGIVKDIANPPIWVVQKDAGLGTLLNTINNAIETKLPLINRVLIKHFENIQREYMWGFVSENWERFVENEDKILLAYFLSRRLALSLSGSGIVDLAKELGDDGNGIFTQNPVHPLRYYVIPPISIYPQTGDIYKKEDEDNYSILLSPNCDLVPHVDNKQKETPPKAEMVIMAECLSLNTQLEYQDWVGNKDDTNKTNKLFNLMKNNRSGGQLERYYFLPLAFNIPNLLVDFQRTYVLPLPELLNIEHYSRIASLDSPYSEAILTRFVRYFGRVGTPDLNCDIVIRNI